MGERDKRGAPVAVVRVEQLYPFPQHALQTVLARYPAAKDLVWLQEEPANMGPWRYMFHQSHRVQEDGYKMRPVARVESGSPATGLAMIHDQELADLMDATFD
jgi:2-oxoglutarate dehydrogenase E1 component